MTRKLDFAAVWLLQASVCMAITGCAAFDKSSPSALDWTKWSGRQDPDRPQQSGDRPQQDVAAPTQPTNSSNKKTASPQEIAEYVKEISRGKDLEHSKQRDEARKVYERLIREQPGRYEAYHRLALVADSQRRYQEAQTRYAEAIALNNRDPNLFNDLGYSFFLQGKLDKAEAAILKAVAMRPNETKYHNNLGLVYGHQKRYDDAWEQFRMAEGEANAYYNMAFVRASQNDFQAAKACFRRALAVDPTNEQARRALRAFEIAEASPESFPRWDTLTEDGTPWVPYVEGSETENKASRSPTAPAAPASRWSSATSGSVRRSGPIVRTAAQTFRNGSTDAENTERNFTAQPK